MISRAPLLLSLSLLFAVPSLQGAEWVGSFANVHDRVWLGPGYWANPMEDWRVHDGRLECVTGGPNRNVHGLTRQLSKKDGTLTMSVRVGRLDATGAKGSA